MSDLRGILPAHFLTFYMSSSQRPHSSISVVALIDGALVKSDDSHSFLNIPSPQCATRHRAFSLVQCDNPAASCNYSPLSTGQTKPAWPIFSLVVLFVALGRRNAKYKHWNSNACTRHNRQTAPQASQQAFLGGLLRRTRASMPGQYRSQPHPGRIRRYEGSEYG